MNILDIIRPTAVVVAVITSTLIIKSAFQNAFDRRVIEVKGLAERKIQSDLAKWSIEYTAEGHRLDAAYQELSHFEKKILNFLKGRGIKDDEFSLGSSYTQQQRKKDVVNGKLVQTNDIDRYTITKTIVVESKNVEDLRKAAEALEELMGQGINIRTYSMEYFCSNLENLKAELLGEATRNAYLRAQQLASATNSRVGKLKSAKQGIFQITAENSSDTTDYGRYDTNSIKKSIKVVANATFGIE